MSNEKTFPFPTELIRILRSAQKVAVLTGAGISAESGVPTFREAQTGLWAQYDPQQLATPHAFRENPRLVWEWYAWRRKLVTDAAPNAGHYALAQLAARLPGLTLITQNVDGLHQRAGSQDVIELHGNLTRTKCFENEHAVETWPETAEVPPRCPICNGRLRPDVVWFGENLPQLALQSAIRAAAACDLFLTVGTSAIVQPAASLPLTALENNVPTVEINPQATPITPYIDFVLNGPAGEILPALIAAAWP